MKHILLSNCVYSFGPGFKTRGLERNELIDAEFKTMTVCSDLVVLTDVRSFEGLFKNLCFSFIADLFTVLFPF
jgi:hypothetical protein